MARRPARGSCRQARRLVPKIGVVISTLGMHSSLERVLDRYEGQDVEEGTFEVVVAADAAEQDIEPVERLVASRPYPTQLTRGQVPGLSANRNAGWRAVRSPIVLFTDNDTLPERQLIREHLAWHHEHPKEQIGVLGHVRWARELKVTPFMRWLDHGIQFDYPNIKGIRAGWGRFYGANVSMKRTFIERVGDFDAERLPYGYEDLDFAYRASKIGFELLYNRRATVEHLREMTVDFWRRRARRAAVAERQFVRLHPEIPPHFYNLFSDAAAAPPVRGRGVALAPFVPRWVPFLGGRVWTSVDVFYRQALAPDFLAAWKEADSAEAALQLQPDVSEREAEGSAGEAPSGPK
jgi:glycosyltransferase involved in cell wall biosynthesis